MRAAIIAAAFAAAAIAVPFNNNEERDVVTKVKTDVVYYTQVVTAGGAETKPTHHSNWGHWEPKPKHYGHKHPHSGHAHKSKPQPAPQPKPKPEHKNHKPKPQHKPKPKPSPSPSSAPSGGDTSSYSGKTLISHNLHRKNHSANALKWSSSLANTAAEIAADCKFAHVMGKNGGGYGQNIAAGVPGDNITAIVTDMFYNGEVEAFAGQYGRKHPTGFEEWGHFSQLVWKATTHVGCATQDCSSMGGVADAGDNVPAYFTVCNYAGPGNVAGQYAQNVGEPLGEPTANWDTGL